VRKFSIILGCVFVFAAHVFAQGGPPSKGDGRINEEDQRSKGTVSAPPVAQQGVRDQTVRPVQPNATGQPGVNLPPNITPDQVKSFLSRPKEDNYIILNFDNADLRDVINTVSSITKENFIVTPGVSAQVTIHSARKIPVSEVLNVFESVLEANGMTLVKSGEFYKILPGVTAKQKPVEVRKGNQSEDIAPQDRVVTQIVPVEYVSVMEITTVLTPMLSQFGSIIPNSRNNLLIINDTLSNIKRLLQILEEIDVNAFQNTRMLFFKPKFSDVAALTDELTSVLNALNLTRDGVALVPIERINSLVVFSSSSPLLETVEGWLRKLDEEVESGQNIFVYPVQNVKADSIAEILKSLYGSENGTPAKQKTAQPSAQPGAQPQQRAASVQQPRPQAQKQQSGGRVEIITFEPSNSLIILAPPGTYREMVDTIKKLDVYPREVLIEAVVAQVTLTDTDEYGVQWSVLHNVDFGIRDGSDYKALVRNSIANLATSAPTLTSGAAGGLSYVLFSNSGNLSALINALTTRGKVNILSSPRLLVRDQEEASIDVGSEIPTATSTTTSAATTTDVLTQSIQYKTVGIKLKIKPTISEEKTVVLDLEQEVSSQGEDTLVGGLEYPSFNTTKTKTSIVVPDKQGIVIGGIMEETKDKGYSGIPLLSSIPILGHLFRYQSDTITKKELVIIITPQVVSTKEEGRPFTNEFIGKLKEVKKYLTEKEIVYKESPEAQNPSGTGKPGLENKMPALIIAPEEGKTPYKTNEP